MEVMTFRSWMCVSDGENEAYRSFKINISLIKDQLHLYCSLSLKKNNYFYFVQTQPYLYDRKYSTRYTFISKGRKGVIVKIVEFTPTTVRNLLNLGFGDLLPDGSVDDAANSNNGDIVKVLATIISIIEDFTTEYPDIKVVFAGSTVRRTLLYQRIMKMYYQDFKKDFIITALKDNGNENYREVFFEPDSNNKYAAFFIKRK